jgi:hypothetical protein
LGVNWERAKEEHVATAVTWKISGQYYETCSCDFVCPCILTQLQAKPTKGSCTFAMSFKIDKGTFGDVSLDGLGFVVVGFTPAEMGKGNWTAGVIVDERASVAQRDALVTIASGGAGGPMAALSGMITTFAGVESAPIRFERDGPKWSVNAATFVSMSAEPAMGIDPTATEPLELGNTGHPANSRVSLAHALHSAVNVLGLAWNDDSGRNNGQYAPFTWANA